jgi:hypothetical protein
MDALKLAMTTIPAMSLTAAMSVMVVIVFDGVVTNLMAIFAFLASIKVAVDIIKLLTRDTGDSKKRFYFYFLLQVLVVVGVLLLTIKPF